jgi:hypothetical protein
MASRISASDDAADRLGTIPDELVRHPCRVGSKR